MWRGILYPLHPSFLPSPFPSPWFPLWVFLWTPCSSPPSPPLLNWPTMAASSPASLDALSPFGPISVVPSSLTTSEPENETIAPTVLMPSSDSFYFHSGLFAEAEVVAMAEQLVASTLAFAVRLPVPLAALPLPPHPLRLPTPFPLLLLFLPPAPALSPPRRKLTSAVVSPDVVSLPPLGTCPKPSRRCNSVVLPRGPTTPPSVSFTLKPEVPSPAHLPRTT